VKKVILSKRKIKIIIIISVKKVVLSKENIFKSILIYSLKKCIFYLRKKIQYEGTIMLNEKKFVKTAQTKTS
jgi:hypothetical protein